VRHLKTWLTAGGAMLLAVSSLSSCSKEASETVTVYVSADEHLARQVIAEFEKDTGIAVKMVGDTEVKKTAGLVERIISESDHPQADVFWSSEIFMTIALAERGALAPHESPAVKDWPKEWRDEQNRWFGFSARARVIVYSPQRVPPERVPKSWMALATDDHFKGRIAMADPRFGTTGGHLGAMKCYWEVRMMPGYFGAYGEGLAEQNIRVLPSGNAGVVDAVALGEADVGMTDTDDVWAAQALGKDVQLVYPAHNMDASVPGSGTLLIPNTVARIRGARHAAQAAKLVDYLLSEKVERMLAESPSHNIPLRPSLASAFPKYAVPNPLKVNYQEAANLRLGAIEQLMNAVDEQKSSAHETREPASRPQEPFPPLKDGSAP